jgi:hypothetical protein
MKTVRIGNGSGFWGDYFQASSDLLPIWQLDYLTLDYLAELTMSILALQKQRDPRAGFAKDFPQLVHHLATRFAQRVAQPGDRFPKVVANAGGLNPRGCALAVAEALKQTGHVARVGVVDGDDLLPRLDELLAQGHVFANIDTGEPLSMVRDRVVSANAYLGARPIAEALQRGADIVVTGRVADASLTVGPAAHEFGWAWDDWDRLAAATVAGHLIECGAQVSGGLWCNWREVTDWDTNGYPFLAMTDDGAFDITASGTGVNRETLTEQLLYEVGDPARYLTPDVVADFTSIALHTVDPRTMRVTDSKGTPATDSYKVSIAYRDGFMASGTLVLAGPDAVAKARACGDTILKRFGQREGQRVNVEFLGAGAVAPGVLPAASDPPEVVLRVTAHTRNKEDLEQSFTRLFAPLVTSGPPGVTGYTSGRPVVREVFAYWPALVAKSVVQPRVEILP